LERGAHLALFARHQLEIIVFPINRLDIAPIRPFPHGQVDQEGKLRARILHCYVVFRGFLIYATGGGLTDPPVADGIIAGNALSKPKLGIGAVVLANDQGIENSRSDGLVRDFAGT